MRSVAVVLTVMLILAGCASQEMTSGKIYMQQENWDKAVEFFSAEVEKSPSNPEAYMWLARAYTQKKEYELAAENFSEARRLDPEIVEPDEKTFVWSVYNAAGEKAANREDYPSAIAYFNNSAKLQPDSAVTYTFLAYAYSQMQDTVATIESYKTAIEKEPSDSEVRLKLAQYYMSIKKYEEAIQEFTETVEIDPLNALAFYNMGVCYSHLKEFENAEKSFEDAIEINPSYGDAFFNLAMTYIQINEPEKAKSTLLKAVEANPEDAEAYSFLGMIYLQDKEYQKAVDTYTKAIEFKSEDPILYYNRATAYFGLGKTAEQQADEAKAKELEER